MRIALFVLIIVTIIAMIYYLTANPIDATGHLLQYDKQVDAKSKSIVLIRYILIYVTIAVIWNLIMPNILAYYKQPIVSENVVLERMPQYSNAYVYEAERLNIYPRAQVKAYYMPKGATYTQSTDKRVYTDYVISESDTPILEIQYRDAKTKSPIYFFMDSLTWPKERKIEHYTFYVPNTWF